MMNRFNSPVAGPSREAAVVRALTAALGTHQAGAGGAGSLHVVPEPTLRLGGDAVQPSLAAWPKGVAIEQKEGEPILRVPVWVCEICSRGRAREIRVTKQTIYRRVQVPFVWLLDVDLHTFETFSLLDGRMTELDAYSDDDRVRAAPFESVELDLAALWAELEVRGDCK